MLCYAACPQYGLNPKFIGPGVLALLHRYNADSRDGGASERMQIVNAEEGVWSCTAVGYCSEVCPKHVDPANAVNQNKVNSAKDYFLRFLAPKGGRNMNHDGDAARRPYVRPMQGWWRRDPFFVRYMVREATALSSSLVYAIVLLVGVVRLAQGEAAWNGWLAALRSAVVACCCTWRCWSRWSYPRLELVRDHAQDHADDVRRRQARVGARPSRAPAGLAAVLASRRAVRARLVGWRRMKRSNAPVFWLLFGAGGMLSALLGAGAGVHHRHRRAAGLAAAGRTC